MAHESAYAHAHIAVYARAFRGNMAALADSGEEADEYDSLAEKQVEYTYILHAYARCYI